MRIRKAWWNTIVSIRGFEDPAGDGGEGGSGEGGQGGEGAGDGASSGGSGDEGGQGDGGEGAEDTSGLKSALQKERANNKDLAKRLKAFEKAQQEKADAEKTEIQRLTDSSTKSSEKITKLATAFRTSKVEEAVLRAAGSAKFTDPTDALRVEVLNAIEVEQDEDDPSKVTVDADSVKKAVEALAKSKPHYLAQEEDTRRQRPPSGSKFGGSGGNKPSRDEQLKAQYPALARRG